MVRMARSNMDHNSMDYGVFATHGLQGLESECWLDLAKGEWVGGRVSFELQNAKIPISIFEDIDPIFKIVKNR